MDRVLFNRERFDHLYNCSYFTHDEWAEHGRVNKPIGFIYLTVGIIYECLYIPFMIVMARKEYIQHSCYKIMFFLGIIDIIAVWCNSLMAGYFSLVGAVYCTHPFWVFTVAVMSTSCWCAACATVFLLAFNRFMDLISRHFSQLLFQGSRTYFWLALPFGYWFYFWFWDLPCFYTSAYSACFFDPYFGMEVPHNKGEYTSWGHTLNNIVIIIALSGMYIAVISALIIKTRVTNSSSISSAQRQTILQAFLICSLCFIASTIYVWMQFLPIAPFMIVMAQFFWQASHGGAVFVYLIFNKSLRRAMFQLVFHKKPQSTSQVSSSKVKSTTLLTGTANSVSNTNNNVPSLPAASLPAAGLPALAVLPPPTRLPPITLPH